MAEAKIAAVEADLKAAQAAQGVAKANIDLAATGVSKAEALAAYTKIVAPFDGVVTRRGVSPGDLVQAATAGRTTVLFTLQRTDRLRVACDLPEAGSASVHVGDPAEVRFPAIGGDATRASVTRVAGAVNPSTRTMRVEIDLDNRDGRLRPGIYAQVTLTPGSPPRTRPPRNTLDHATPPMPTPHAATRPSPLRLACLLAARIGGRLRRRPQAAG